MFRINHPMFKAPTDQPSAAAATETVTPDQVGDAAKELGLTVAERDENGRSITVHNPDSSIVGMFMNGANQSNFLSSLQDDGTAATKARIYNAMNDNDGNLADLADAGEIISVEHFMIYPCQFEDQDGDMQEGVRCVLVTPEGKSYAAMANGVFSSLQKIAGVAGMAPWTPAIRVAPVRKKTRKGFYTLTLRMIP